VSLRKIQGLFKALDEANENGLLVVDIKNDRKKIYP